MTAPYRGNTGYSCYFVRASTFQKQRLLQSDTMAQLFVDVLLHYRRRNRYLLHEFVVMPDHFHLLLTPAETPERALQLIKGGSAYRARKELGFAGSIRQPSYYDHRVRDAKEYWAFRKYIHLNPVRARLVESPKQYPYSSANPRFQLDGLPQRIFEIHSHIISPAFGQSSSTPCPE